MSLSGPSVNFTGQQRARIYLDCNATTPLATEVQRAIIAGMSAFGNPSSVHGEGRRAREAVEDARRALAALLATEPESLVFTSGGTEADCLGIVGLARAAAGAGRPRVVATTAITVTNPPRNADLPNRDEIRSAIDVMRSARPIRTNRRRIYHQPTNTHVGPRSMVRYSNPDRAANPTAP